MTIAEVISADRAPQDGGLLGFAVDAPTAGATFPTYSIRLSGWVVGRTARATAVEVRHQDRLIRNLPVQLPRPDVGELHSTVAHAAQSGFDSQLGLLGLPASCELSLLAVFDDGRRAPLATLGVRRRRLRSTFEPQIEPIVVTSLFRMGTTRLMRLLAEHESVVVQRAYPYETRVFGYWMHALKVLSDPADLHGSSHPDDLLRKPSWIGHNPFDRPPMSDHPLVAKRLGCDGPAELATFCQSAAERFYATVAQSQDEPAPRYFAEKHVPDSFPPSLAHELYDGAREIFLVRDFRDMVCSILAFNRKRGYLSFGRQHVGSDAELVQQLGERGQALLDAWRERSHRALLVRYEDLVLDPEATLHRVLDHLDLDGSGEAVRLLLERAADGGEQLNFHRTTRRPQESIGRFERDLDPALVGECRTAFGEALEAFGYNATGSARRIREAAST